MQCHHPQTIRQEDKSITVPCGRCMPCRVNHAQQWSFRLKQEMETCSSAVFLTLTYEDSELLRNDSGHPDLYKPDLQKFFKRLRYYTAQEEIEAVNAIKTNQIVRFPKIKYYACGEFGGETFRPHYHAIVFNVPHKVLEKLNQIWKLGFIYTGTVTQHSINYVTKYITKIDTRDLELKDLTPPFNVMSKGIGANYITDENKDYHSRYSSMLHRREAGKYKRIPKYYDDKIHDLTDETTAKKLKRYKDYRKFKNDVRKIKEDKELIRKGLDPYKVQEERIKNEKRIFNQSKRTKL